MKTNWQDPGSDEIFSTHIAGLQEAVGKVETILDMRVVAVTDQALSELYITEADRYRIYQIAGKRNWLANPVPIIKKNGEEITTGFTIDYGGGGVIFVPRLSPADAVSATFTYVTGEAGVGFAPSLKTMDGEVYIKSPPKLYLYVDDAGNVYYRETGDGNAFAEIADEIYVWEV